MARVTALLVASLAALLPTVIADCQPLGGNCGDSRVTSCCSTGYCQPWNSGYYQCIDAPTKCPNQETDVDYYGHDLQTIEGLSPAQCCDKCANTDACAAYTFINENPDGKTRCYLKTSGAGRVAKKGAVSAVAIKSCSNKVGDGCGNAQTGSTCCPSGSYCQPWNQWYYQCVALPAADKCSEVLEGIDFYGDDLRTVYGLLPSGCCDECYRDDACAAYTFVNENADGKTACYLKKGEGVHKYDAKAVSGRKHCVL